MSRHSNNDLRKQTGRIVNTYFFKESIFFRVAHVLPYFVLKIILIYAIRFGFMSRSRSKATALEYMGPMNMSRFLVVIL